MLDSSVDRTKMNWLCLIAGEQLPAPLAPPFAAPGLVLLQCHPPVRIGKSERLVDAAVPVRGIGQKTEHLGPAPPRLLIPG